MANPLFKISMGLDKDLPSGKVPGQVYVTTDKKKMHIDVDGDTRIVLNAAEADKLKTAQSVQVNLASTSSSSFDGTAGISPGVTGVLKVGNGGTGASDHVANRLVWSESANKIRASYHYADSTRVAINTTSVPNTNFHVNGTSTFNGDVSLNVDNNDRYLTFNYTGGTGYNWRIGYLGSGAGEANYLVFQSNKEGGASYQNALRFGLTSLDAAFGGNVYPLVDNTQTLGTSTFKWATIYATQLEGNAKSATQLITERVLKIGNTGKTFNGTKNVTWTNNEIGFLDLINRGTELADEADMNDVGYGNFYSNNSTKSGTLVNGPLTSAGFRLISMRGYNSSATAYHWQYAITSSRRIYQRYRDGDNNWSGWGTFVLNNSTSAVGSATLPTYINSSGIATACTASSLFSNLSWTGGTTAGPTLNVTVAGQARSAAIPNASASTSGIVTTNSQHFSGQKFFNAAPVMYNHNTSPSLYFYPKEAKRTQGSLQCAYTHTDGIGTGNRMQIVEWSYNSTTAAANSYYEIYNFPKVTADRTSNASYEIFTSKSYSTLDSRYVNASGDTMTGILTFKNTTTKPTNGQQLPILRMTYQNGDGTYYGNNNIIAMLGTGETSTTNNAAVRFGSSNGCTYITSGESSTAMPAKLGSAGEHLYLTSDGGIYFYTSCANDGASYTQTLTLTSSKITANVKLYGAVWNDYAEYRSCKEEFKPGQVVYENGDDTMSISNSRLQRGCSIVSDTFGFAIGETDEAKCPIAVSGRVLAYGYEPREEFKKHIGWPVCSGPNGTVSIMTEEEEEKYPSRIIGTISAVPDYETWGTEEVEVDGRIWIKVK